MEPKQPLYEMTPRYTILRVFPILVCNNNCKFFACPHAQVLSAFPTFKTEGDFHYLTYIGEFARPSMRVFFSI